MFPSLQSFLVLGLSRSGSAATEFLLSRGATCYIYDDISTERVESVAESLCKKGAKRATEASLPSMSDICDALVLSPGIPIDHALAVAFKRKGKAVIGETELAARYMRCPIVAVTGTNGKTTTVSMLTEILRAGGFSAHACGNVGTPMIAYCELSEEKIAVAEISSFQLETLNSLNPHIAVVLNVTEDHLNRHYNMENYVFLKSKILKNASEAEYAVLNYDDRTVRAFAEKTKARIVWFSLRERINGAYYENGGLYYKSEKILSADELPIDGLHNIQNALAAIATAKILKVENDAIKKAIVGFKGIRHRIEFVTEIDGVAYIDDSKGTNVDATVKAVQCMKRDTVLLLGGKNKGYDYTKLFAVLTNSKVKAVVLYGENRYELLKCAREKAFSCVSVCERFELAVRIAAMTATEGQTVLLSPASASFDEFTGYEERGDKFVEIVRSMAKAREEKDGGARTVESNAPCKADSGEERYESETDDEPILVETTE